MHFISSSELSRQEPIELPLTESTQQALHEAVAHLYDAFATATLEGDAEVPEVAFDELEALYVATGEGSLSRVRIDYECESDRDRTVEH